MVSKSGYLYKGSRLFLLSLFRFFWGQNPNDVKLMLDNKENYRISDKESMPSGLGLNRGSLGDVGSFK